jgi:putative Holliday junction resolvase
MAQKEYILGIDYGAKRVGVALAHTIARLPRPLTTIANTAELMGVLETMIADESVGTVVVGVPRAMDGSTTEQSALCEAFAQKLSSRVDVPVFTVDETLSSVEAEDFLGTSQKHFTKAEIDAVAAACILDRFISGEDATEVAREAAP